MSRYLVQRWLGSSSEEGQMVTGVPVTSVRCSARCGHVSACIGEDLIVWGGYNNEPQADQQNPDMNSRYLSPLELWIYNTDLDCWTCRQCRIGEGDYGEFHKGMSGASSMLIFPHWYIIGGHNYQGNMGCVFRLNLHTFVWEKVRTSQPGLSPRDKFTAWAYKHRIYCFGGFGYDPKYNGVSERNYQYVEETDEGFDRGWNNQLVVLDLETQEWSSPRCLGPVPSPRAAHTAVLVEDRVYIFGGRHLDQRLNDLHCLSLKSMTWSGELTVTGPVPQGRSWHTLTSIGHDRLMLFGGFSQDQRTLDDVWVLNTACLQWTPIHPGNRQPRLWHTASITDSGTVLVFGGCKTNILGEEREERFSGLVLKFETQPKRLDCLCLHAVFQHKKQTKREWDCLPQEIQQWLAQKRAVTKQLQRSHTRRRKSGVSVNGFTDISPRHSVQRNQCRLS